jgi:hypothetical protein
MKLAVILLILGYSASAFCQGGASTVGDGGHGVDCKYSARFQLLDVFEFADGKEITLPESQSAMKSFPQLLTRAQAALRLSTEEVGNLRITAKRFFSFKIDPWAMGLAQYNYFLQAKEPVISDNVWKRIEDEDCYIEPIVIKPDPNAESIRIYSSLCSMSLAGFEHCFLVNDRGFRKLSHPAQACLVLHESLRFLPRSKKLNEPELRALTARLCTQ